MTTSKMGFTEGEGINIASHSFLEGGITKHIERIAPGACVLDAYDDTATISAVGLVADFSSNCTGKGRVILAMKAEAALSDYCLFRLVFKNGAGDVIGPTVLLQSTFAELMSGGSPNYRYGTAIAFANDLAAASVELYVVQLPPNGTVIAYIGSV